MKSWESQDVAYRLTEMKLHLLEKCVAFIYQQSNITSINSCWTLTGLAERGYVRPYSSVQLTGYWYWHFDSWTLIDSTSNGTLLWFFSTFSCKEFWGYEATHVFKEVQLHLSAQSQIHSSFLKNVMEFRSQSRESYCKIEKNVISYCQVLQSMCSIHMR